MHGQYAAQIERHQQLIAQIESRRISNEQAESLLKEDAQVPLEAAQRYVCLQGRLHSEVLSTILNVCFALESYINTLGFHLLKERDILGLVANSNSSTVDAFILAIDRLSTVSKWETIGKLKSDAGYERGKSPFQDLKILFDFRNDHVHDKVVDYDNDRQRKRYNGRLPDPVFGLLELVHAVYACDCYWSMITQVHSLTGVPIEEFHRHWNLLPWFDREFENTVRSVCSQYRSVGKHAS